jgi:hypothetical protein
MAMATLCFPWHFRANAGCVYRMLTLAADLSCTPPPIALTSAQQLLLIIACLQGPALTVHGDGNIGLPLVLQSKRQACAQGDLSPHDAVAPVEVGSPVVPAHTHNSSTVLRSGVESGSGASSFGRMRPTQQCTPDTGKRRMPSCQPLAGSLWILCYATMWHRLDENKALLPVKLKLTAYGIL